MSAQRGPVDVTVIEGAKRPELIPQWYLWQETLRTVSRRPPPRPDEAALDQQIGLTGADMAVLKSAAAAAMKEEGEYVAKLTALVTQLRSQGKTTRQLFEAVRPLEIEQRWAVLAHGDKVNEKLSPDGRIALWSWIRVAVIEGAVIRVPNAELAHFRAPK